MNDLLRWKRDQNKKPMLLYGNKQIGKTYTVLEFAEKEYPSVLYFDCQNNFELDEIMKRETAIDRILLQLSLLSGETIRENDTLFIFDNIQNKALISFIKRLGHEKKTYPVIMITSEKEKVLEIKGEDVLLKYMFALDFEEYLKAVDQAQLIDFIKESYKYDKPMPFHNIAMAYYDNYLISGGLPEAILETMKHENTLYLNSIHHKILDTYQTGFLNQPELIDIIRAQEVFSIIPDQLKKPNKKFQYGKIKAGSRSKDYEHAILFLVNNNLVNPAFKITDIKTPLSKHKEKDSFKLYMSDTGLLFHMLHLTKMKYLSDDRMRYILYENALANSIMSSGYNLYYYQSEGKAEISFVVQSRKGKIVPIELVNKNVSKAKSLALFMNKYEITEGIRVTADNFSKKKGIKYIPIYATFCFKENL